MGKRIRLLLPFLLPFFLSLFPVFLLSWENRERQTLTRERFLDEWQRRAADKVEQLRADHLLETRLNRYNYDLRRRLEHILAARPQSTFTGALFQRAYRTSFPLSHRPEAATLYVFAVTPQKKVEVLSGQGLASMKKQVFSRLFSAFLQVKTLSDQEKATVDRTLRGVMGFLARLDLLASNRRGLTTPVRFGGKNGLFLWDTVSRDKKIIGGYLLVFPVPANRDKLRLASLRHALGTLGGPKKPFSQSTLLVPLEAAASTTPVIVPREWAKDPEIQRLLRRLRRPFMRSSLVPSGRVSERIPGLRIFRQSLSLSLPYEIWVVSPTSQGISYQGNDWSRLLGLLFVFGWLGIFVRILISGEMLPISMKSWFLGFFILVGVLPVSALYLAGNLQIDTAREREIRDRIVAAEEAFEEMNSNANLTFSRFVEESFSFFANSRISRLLMQPGPKQLAEVIRQGRMFFAPGGLFEPAMLIFRSGKPTFIETLSGNPVDSRLEAIGRFYIPFLYEAIQLLDSKWIPFELGKKDSQASILKAIYGGGFVGRDLGFNLLQMRGHGDLIEWYDDYLYHYYEFVGNESGIRSGILWREQAWYAVRKYLLQSFTNASRHTPENSYAVGHLNPGGFDPLFPPSGSSFWRSIGAKRLHSNLVRCSRTRKQQTQIDTRSKTATLVFPTTKPKGYLLGTVVNLEDLFLKARHKQVGLSIVSCLLLFAIILIGVSFSNFLLEPLQSVEQGLRKAAAGDLSHPLRMVRDDELGMMTTRFDQMIDGLRKRRELGRFVSGTLEFEMGAKGQGQSRKFSRKIVAVLVSDIRDFTTISESNTVRRVVSMLNFHLASMTEIITQNGGVIDKFVGDAVVAVFFGETPQESIDNAMHAALAMNDCHWKIQHDRRKSGEFFYEIGIGIDFGSVLVGSLTATRRQEWFILGPPMARAEQLEGESKKALQTKIMVSPTLAEISAPRFFFGEVPGTDAKELLGKKGNA
jgi:class 3 adenylate cyclase